VLLVTDSRISRLVELPARRGGLLRMCVHLPCAEGVVGITEVRTLLVGDVLLRAVEANGVQVVHEIVHPELPPEQAKALDRAVTALGIHRPADAVGSAQVHVFGEKQGPAPTEGIWIEVGPVRQSVADIPGLDEGDGADPLVARLALLSHAYGRPFALTAQRLADAERTLRQWRHRVADWARAPSRPIPDDIRRQARAALAEDLGTPALLSVLRGVEAAPEMAEGAKFETFAHLDRVLGLELIRDVGRG
jgi:hypothetical protein